MLLFVVVSCDEENKVEELDGEEEEIFSEFSVWSLMRFYLLFMKFIYYFGFKELIKI